MATPALEALLHRAEQAPDNIVLRLAVIRRANEAGLASRALALVLDLDPDAVPSTDDRGYIADLLDNTGLSDDAAAWRQTVGAAAAGPVPTVERVPDTQDVAPSAARTPAYDTPKTASDSDVRDAATLAAASGDRSAKDPAVEDPRPALRVVGGRETDADATDDADPPLTFADVGGLRDVKREIERRIIAPFKQSTLLSRFKRRAGGGVLLYGPPGCGKTMIARATAGECGMGFMAVPISDILDPLHGMSERHLTAIFDKARNSAPTVLFFDEIDALGAKRSSSTATHHAQLVSHFLAQMDGIDGRNAGVLVLAATNIPWSMDSAFLRPGRFDRLFFVPPPDREAREAILRLEMADRPTVPGMRFDRAAERTSGLSGADLSDIVERATDEAIDETLAAGREVQIDQPMLDRAVGEVRSSVTDWLSTARNHATFSNESGRYDDVLEFLKKHGRT